MASDFLAVYNACVYCILNSFHARHNAEHHADPIRLVAELAAFLAGLRVGQRIYEKTLTFAFPPKQNEANDNKEETKERLPNTIMQVNQPHFKSALKGIHINDH